jgi:RNA polymerase sigma factor (TIGR02999 family)
LMNEVTQILGAMQQGDPKAADELLPLVYQELRRIAAHKMANESPGQTLQPTALVHEAWLRLVGAEQQTWQNRVHFFGAAAEAMRRILIDNARRKKALRRGGGQQRLDNHELEIAVVTEDDQLLAVNEALDKLAAQDEEAADLVKLRYFIGMTIEKAAQTLGIGEATATLLGLRARLALQGNQILLSVAADVRRLISNAELGTWSAEQEVRASLRRLLQAFRGGDY